VPAGTRLLLSQLCLAPQAARSSKQACHAARISFSQIFFSQIFFNQDFSFLSAEDA